MNPALLNPPPTSYASSHFLFPRHGLSPPSWKKSDSVVRPSFPQQSHTTRLELSPLYTQVSFSDFLVVLPSIFYPPCIIHSDYLVPTFRFSKFPPLFPIVMPFPTDALPVRKARKPLPLPLLLPFFLYGGS